MGEKIEFEINGAVGSGYLALPASSSGPAVIVIQEWWGLVGHITDVVDRFAAAGFIAFAPDLYHGQAASEPDTSPNNIRNCRNCRFLHGRIPLHLERNIGSHY